MKFPIRIILAALTLGATAAAHGQPVSVPLGFDAQGRPTAPVSINGRSPVTMVIDSAAQRTGLGAPLVAELGLSPIPANAMLHGASGAQRMNLYRLDALAIGALRREGVAAIEMAARGATHNHGGVVGADFFQGRRVEFDFANQRFNVDAGGAATPRGFAAVPANFLFETFALVPVTVGGVEAIGVVDTGARHSIANPALMRALGYGETDPRLTAEQAHGGATGHASVIRRGGRSGIRIGTGTAREIGLSFADLPVFGALSLAERPTIILGMDVLRQSSALAIDYVRREVQVRD